MSIHQLAILTLRVGVAKSDLPKVRRQSRPAPKAAIYDLADTWCRRGLVSPKNVRL